MPPPRRLLLACAALVLLGLTACGSDDRQPYDLDIPGCSSPARVHPSSPGPGPRTVDAIIDGCISDTVSVDRVANLVWQLERTDPGVVRIRTASAGSPLVVLTRDELQRRFGAVPRRADNPLDWLALILPLVPIGGVVLAVMVLRGASSRGMVVIIGRR